jgi:hypothetical protein
MEKWVERRKEVHVTVMGKYTSIVSALLVMYDRPAALATGTFQVQRGLSESMAIIFVRSVRFDKRDHLYHARDFFENGQIQMDVTCNTRNRNENLAEKRWPLTSV